MKFYETHFEDYIQSSNNHNIHKKLDAIYKKFPTQLCDLKNLIFYGPEGIGKYTQTLRALAQYSPSKLKYEKKIAITHPTDKLKTFNFKISDIHFEIDMALLGCNSKLLWNEIYNNICDIIAAKTENVGVILCKNFNSIHNDLLESFYSYMQNIKSLSIDIKYIILTEQISFIPNNIISCCEIISIPRPTKTNYKKISLNKQNSDINCVNNIKALHTNISQLTQPHKIICDKIIHDIINVQDLKFQSFRDKLYDIFIYNLNISECVWYIINKLLVEKHIAPNHLSSILIKTYGFFKYYNNNYRPIYHLESFIFYLISIVHGYKSGV